MIGSPFKGFYEGKFAKNGQISKNSTSIDFIRIFLLHKIEEFIDILRPHAQSIGVEILLGRQNGSAL